MGQSNTHCRHCQNRPPHKERFAGGALWIEIAVADGEEGREAEVSGRKEPPLILERGKDDGAAEPDHEEREDGVRDCGEFAGSVVLG